MIDAQANVSTPLEGALRHTKTAIVVHRSLHGEAEKTYV